MMNTIEYDNFQYEISYFAIENLKEHSDLGKATELLLGKVAQQYHLNNVIIMENKPELECFRVFYEWSRDNNTSLNHVMSCSKEFENFFREKMNNGEIITHKDYIDYSSNINIEKLLHKNHCNSIISLPYITGDNKTGLIIFVSPKENYIFTDCEIKTLYHLRDILVNFYFVVRDYHDAKDRLEQILKYDSVTGLFNYDTFVNHAESLFELENEETNYIIISADIINFKYFNEFYGYSSGDEVLRLFNQSISVIFNKVLVSRVFSDNFVVLGKIGKGVTEERISRALDAFNKVFSDKVHGIYKETTLQIVAGVNIFADTNLGIKTYIDNADKARKAAKLASKRTVIYNETMDNELRRNILISNIAEDALLKDEFYFELQPKYHLKDKVVIGAEALVRWKREDGSMMFPNEFIPVFEQNEFIIKLDFYIYAKVCEYLRKRIDSGESIIPISVNVSRVHLRCNDFVKRIIQLVDLYQIPHHLLEFEITESIFLENAKSARIAMMRLKNAGFIVSMDDFGAGYSSLNLLKNLDFDILKLDKEFLAQGGIQKKDEIVITSIISMAKKMKITVLCEGVETKEQAEFLESLECDLVQGYYFGRPMNPEQFDLLYQ